MVTVTVSADITVPAAAGGKLLGLIGVGDALAVAARVDGGRSPPALVCRSDWAWLPSWVSTWPICSCQLAMSEALATVSVLALTPRWWALGSVTVNP